MSDGGKLQESQALADASGFRQKFSDGFRRIVNRGRLMSMPSRRTSRIALMLIGLMIAIAVGARRENADPAPRFATVRPTIGDVVRTVPGDGEVRTYRPAVVYSDVRAHPRYVIEMVPQGTWVRKGDVVCVLDASEFKQKLSTPVLAVIADNARLQKSQSDEIIQEFINARRTMNSAFAVQLAENKLKGYEQGEYPTRVSRLVGTVSTREDSYQQALDELREMQRLAQNGIVSSASVAAARRRFESSEIELGLAEGEVVLYEDFLNPRSMAQFTADAENAVAELDRTELRNNVESMMAKVWTLSFRKYRAGWQEYVDYLTRCIEKCTMRAPRDGQVVYLNEHDKHIEVGKTVHYTQKVFTVSDRNQLAVAARVSDRFFYSLRKGQPVSIRVEAMPDRIFPGTVTWLGPIPTRLSRFAPESLHHKVEILLDDSGETIADLFPGMTARAEFIVETRKNVLRIPADAVIEHNGEYVVLVSEPSGLTRRVVKVGTSNDEVIEIRDGLSETDNVVVDTVEALRNLLEHE